MLIDDADRYIELRRSLGFARKDGPTPHRVARYAVDRGDTHVRRETAIAWATAVSSTRAVTSGGFRRSRSLPASSTRRIASMKCRIMPVALQHVPRLISTRQELARMLDAAQSAAPGPARSGATSM